MKEMFLSACWSLLVLLGGGYSGLLASWTTIKNLEHGGWWTAATWLVSLLFPWFLISRYSTNIVFDALLFDVGMVSAFYMLTIYLSDRPLNVCHFVAIALCAAGIFLFKVSG